MSKKELEECLDKQSDERTRRMLEKLFNDGSINKQLYDFGIEVCKKIMGPYYPNMKDYEKYGDAFIEVRMDDEQKD